MLPRFKNYVLIPFFVLTLFFLHIENVSAQSFTSPTGEVGALRTGSVNFTASLPTIEDYRFEFGVSGESDKYIQYNLDMTSNINCNPPTEGWSDGNKNAQNLQLSCTPTGAVRTINGVLSLSPFNLTPGVYDLNIKSGRSGGNPVSTLKVRVLESATISLNRTSITPGTPVTASLRRLAPNTQYRLQLYLENGSASGRSFLTFSTNENGCAQTSPGVFSISSCTKDQNGGAISAEISINTTGYNCNPSKASGLCEFYLYQSATNTGAPIARANLEVLTQQGTFALEISPSLPYNTDEVSVTATGCTPDANARVDFRWWRLQEAELQIGENNTTRDFANLTEEQIQAIRNGDPAYNEAETGSRLQVPLNSAGVATVNIGKLGTDSTPEPYLIVALCSSNNSFAHKDFGVSREGVENAVIAPDATIPGQPEPNTTFTIQLTGLDTTDICYYFKIKDLEADNFAHHESGPILGCEAGIDSGVDLGDADAMSQLYESFSEGERDRIFTIEGGLSEGTYRFELWSAATGFTDNEKKSAWVTFGVGKEVEDIPPRIPPCGNNINENEGKCDSVNTSLGFPISTDPAGLVRSVLGILLSISGGIAILLIMYSGYKLMTSNGNPETVQGAREILTSAIVGLIFIIFSVVILQVITVDILKIPGFGF